VDAVGAEGDFLFAGKVAVGDVGGVEAGDEVGDGGYAESDVLFHVLADGFGGASHDVELLVGTDAIPEVLVVFERFGDALEAQEFFVEGGAFLEVPDAEGGVIEFEDLGRSRLGIKHSAGKKGGC